MIDWDLPSVALAVLGGAGLGVACAVPFLYFLEVIARSRLMAGVKQLISFVFGSARSRELSEMPAAVRRFFLEKMDEGSRLPPQVHQWLRATSRRLNKAGVSFAIGRYALATVCGAGTGFLLGVVWLRNLPAAVALGAAAFLVPDSFLIGRIQARRNRMIEQMGAAIRIFAGEYAETPQVPPALARTAQRLPPPLGPVLARAARDLIAGQDRDRVLAALMDALDFEYGRMFVHLLRLAYEDSAVGPLFPRLATRIGSLQSLIQKNRSELAYNRIVGFGLNLLILPIFFAVRLLIPGSSVFLLQHPAGRILVFLSIFSVLLGLALDRILSEVEV